MSVLSREILRIRIPIKAGLLTRWVYWLGLAIESGIAFDGDIIRKGRLRQGSKPDEGSKSA